MYKPIHTFEDGTIYVHESTLACNGSLLINYMVGDIRYLGINEPTEDEKQIVLFTISACTTPKWVSEVGEDVTVITINVENLVLTQEFLLLVPTTLELLQELEKLLPRDNPIRLKRERIREELIATYWNE